MPKLLKSTVLILLLLFFCPVFVLAEDITITTYYPSPYGSYKNLTIYNQDESITQTDFTQSLTKAGLIIATDYTANAYTPGIFWSTGDDNPTKPKAGIYLKETGTGTNMYFGTSNSYATGITNDAVVISPGGTLTATAVSAPNMTLQTVYKNWSTVTSTSTTYTYADVNASDLTITAKRTGSIFKITVYAQGYQSGACSNIGIKYVGTGALILGVNGATGDTWMGTGNGPATNAWSITRVAFHNPGAVAGSTYTYRAMLGLWSAGTTYLNYSGYSGNSTIVIEEIGQ